MLGVKLGVAVCLGVVAALFAMVGGGVNTHLPGKLGILSGKETSLGLNALEGVIQVQLGDKCTACSTSHPSGHPEASANLTVQGTHAPTKGPANSCGCGSGVSVKTKVDAKLTAGTGSGGCECSGGAGLLVHVNATDNTKVKTGNMKLLQVNTTTGAAVNTDVGVKANAGLSAGLSLEP